jgi:D-sedoheptulose 7-phosphate isomerase
VSRTGAPRSVPGRAAVARGADEPAAERPLPTGRRHIAALQAALGPLAAEADRVDLWGAHAARVLLGGGRLLAAGNGGSAAEAQHLTAELVGRYRDDRMPLSALALHADTSSLTAITNDYGGDEAFARQVRAHGRPGDICVLLSTSGRSPNVVQAARAAAAGRLVVWGFTGPRPNPLADACDDAVCVEADATATIQEVHLVLVHLLAAAVDVAVRSELGARAALPGPAAVSAASSAGGHA